MRKNPVIYCALMCLIIWLSASSITIGTNLVKNPGFEASAGKPESWTITGPVATMQPSVTIDSKMKLSEKYSLKMESNNPNVQGKAVQLSVSKEDKHTFSVQGSGQ